MPAFISAVAAIILRPQNANITGLDAWFVQDVRGQSCASCHSPDGIELASFPDGDITRRISRHHQGATAEAIRRLIESRPHGNGSGLDIRPMQPKGLVLTGSNPIERDGAFLDNLEKYFPTLFKTIKNLKDAEAFEKAILDIDVRQLPVGIEMNRLSEDGAHGLEHASIANWFPDVAAFDSSLVRSEAEAYLKNPTTESLRQLDQKVVKVAKVNDAFSILSLQKYRALLVYQHELRTGQKVEVVPEGNPFWQVAEFGRVYAETDALSIHAPVEIANAKNMSMSLHDQMKQIRLPWYWLGWTRDPSVTKRLEMKETLRAEYFCRFLEADGPYMGHEAFMLTRKLAEQKRNPFRPNFPWEIQYSRFLLNTPLIQREPVDRNAKKLFRQFVTNSFKMSLLLLEKDLKEKKKSIRPIPQANQIKFLSQYLTDIKDPQTELVERVKKLLASTPEH